MFSEAAFSQKSHHTQSSGSTPRKALLQNSHDFPDNQAIVKRSGRFIAYKLLLADFTAERYRMPLLQWKPEYAVNDGELDSHHRRLFEFLNSAYENVIKSSEAYCINSVLSELSEYLTYHFSAEEQFMGNNGYQAIDAHIAEHRLFSRNIEALRNIHHDNSLDAAKELIVVLGNWILRHILIEDKKYAEEVCVREVSSSGI